MTVIWNLSRFDCWGSLNGLFFDVYKGRDCFILLQTMQSFFLSRSVWIVIENNYPVLCFDNTLVLTSVKACLQYTQLEQLDKFIWVNPNQYVYMSYTLVRDSIRMWDCFFKNNTCMLAGVTHCHYSRDFCWNTQHNEHEGKECVGRWHRIVLRKKLTQDLF